MIISVKEVHKGSMSGSAPKDAIARKVKVSQRSILAPPEEG